MKAENIKKDFWSTVGLVLLFVYVIAALWTFPIMAVLGLVFAAFYFIKK